MQPAMGDLVDARLPRRAGVPVTDCEQEQRQCSAQGTSEKHRSPLTGRLGYVELHATGKAGSVAGFGVAPLELVSRDAIGGEALDHRLDGSSPGLAHVREILGKLSLIYMDRERSAQRDVLPSTPRRQWAGGQNACRIPPASCAPRLLA